MSGNSFGKLFRVTTWGESHGSSIGCVIDGVPPLIELSEEYIQVFLDKRRPGKSKHTTQRNEPDRVEIISGIFDGKTTGTPISLIIKNQDTRSKDYTDIKDKYRPAHADFTYDKKYGIRDYRGGGRASARETAMRVAAGAVARKILECELKKEIFIKAALIQIGEHKINHNNWNWQAIDNNQFFSPDEEIIDIWDEYLKQIRKEQSSIGAIIEAHAKNIPVGLGEPVFDKLDADIAKAMLSIPAAKGVEIGAGFEVAKLRGEENVDEIRIDENNNPKFLSNNAGGILGGISSGQDIVVRVAFKPTSSIPQELSTITKTGENSKIITKGRHDPCVGIRGVPVVEAMLSIVLADHYLRYKAQCL